MKNIFTFLIFILLIVNSYFTFGTFLSGATGGGSAVFRYLVPLGIAIIAGIIGLSSRNSYQFDNGRKMIIIGLVIPLILFIYAFILNQSDVAKFKQRKVDYENSATIVNIPPYSYKVYPNGGFTPLNVCDAGAGTLECINAIKVWNQH
ncbi:MAG: hypothetical protein WC735_02300 [Candidatus Paceibacterota bacterium]|jgi:hypothetical protein